MNLYALGGGSLVFLAVMIWLLRTYKRSLEDRSLKRQIDILLTQKRKQDAVNKQGDEDTAVGRSRLYNWLRKTK